MYGPTVTTILTGIFLVAALVIYVIILYNRLVDRKNNVNSAWADIDVHLKKRYDLIPSILETASGYAAHEQKTLEKVAAARGSAMRSLAPSEKAAKENILTETLKSFFSVVENYPTLKANEAFLNLQKELGSIENSIESARRYYNALVRDHNILVEIFPANIVAGAFGFTKTEYFSLKEPEKERTPPALRPNR
ncbi:MAG: LemA family protein [Deltaproteobacteria bacterium]|nr:LemA family protein [Deltaproteobacteria bacterium]